MLISDSTCVVILDSYCVTIFILNFFVEMSWDFSKERLWEVIDVRYFSIL